MFKVCYKWNWYAELIEKTVSIAELALLRQWEEERRLLILEVGVLA